MSGVDIAGLVEELRSLADCDARAGGGEPACWTSEVSLKMAAQGLPAVIHAYPPPVEPVALYRGEPHQPAVEAEREACAREADNYDQSPGDDSPMGPVMEGQVAVAQSIAKAIRARTALSSSAGPAVENWKDDPTADERWNAGCDFAMTRLCDYLKVDPASVRWDAATETVDGDVSAVIGNIFTARFGEDWSPAGPAVGWVGDITLQGLKAGREGKIYPAEPCSIGATALYAHPAPATVEMREVLEKIDEARKSVWKRHRHLAAREVALMNDAYDAVAALAPATEGRK